MELMNFDQKKNQSTRHNFITYSHYFDWLHNMATNIFKWDGLPDEVPEHFIEEVLFTRGKALFFRDPDYGFLCLPANGSGIKNVYGEDLAFYAHGFGYSKTITGDEGVLIWNNNTKSATAEIVMAFAGRLATVERVTDTNMNAQKTPILLVGDEKSILTLKNIYKKYEGNEPVIFGDKNFMNNQTVTSINTMAPYVIDKLDVHKMNLWNEALTFLGIKNANTDKRERLITAEVDANDQNTQTNIQIMLTARERAVEKINERFGLNIKVTIRGEENEPVHNGAALSDPAEV